MATLGDAVNNIIKNQSNQSSNTQNSYTDDSTSSLPGKVDPDPSPDGPDASSGPVIPTIQSGAPVEIDGKPIKIHKETEQMVCNCNPHIICITDAHTGLLVAVNPPRAAQKGIICSQPNQNKKQYYQLKKQDYDIKTQTGMQSNQMYKKCTPCSPCPTWPQPGTPPQTPPPVKEKDCSTNMETPCPECLDIAKKEGDKILETLGLSTGKTEFMEVPGKDGPELRISNISAILEEASINVDKLYQLNFYDENILDKLGEAINEYVMQSPAVTKCNAETCKDGCVPEETLDCKKGIRYLEKEIPPIIPSYTTSVNEVDPGNGTKPHKECEPCIAKFYQECDIESGEWMPKALFDTEGNRTDDYEALKQGIIESGVLSEFKTSLMEAKERELQLLIDNGDITGSEANQLLQEYNDYLTPDQMLGDFGTTDPKNPGEIFFRAVEACTEQCNGCVKRPTLSMPDCYECGEYYDPENNCYMEPLYSNCVAEKCTPGPIPPCLECVEYMAGLIKFKHDQCTFPDDWFPVIQKILKDKSSCGFMSEWKTCSETDRSFMGCMTWEDWEALSESDRVNLQRFVEWVKWRAKPIYIDVEEIEQIENWERPSLCQTREPGPDDYAAKKVVTVPKTAYELCFAARCQERPKEDCPTPKETRLTCEICEELRDNDFNIESNFVCTTSKVGEDKPTISAYTACVLENCVFGSKGLETPYKINPNFESDPLSCPDPNPDSKLGQVCIECSHLLDANGTKLPIYDKLYYRDTDFPEYIKVETVTTQEEIQYEEAETTFCINKDKLKYKFISDSGSVVEDTIELIEGDEWYYEIFDPFTNQDILVEFLMGEVTEKDDCYCFNDPIKKIRNIKAIHKQLEPIFYVQNNSGIKSDCEGFDELMEESKRKFDAGNEKFKEVNELIENLGFAPDENTPDYNKMMALKAEGMALNAEGRSLREEAAQLCSDTSDVNNGNGVVTTTPTIKSTSSKPPIQPQPEQKPQPSGKPKPPPKGKPPMASEILPSRCYPNFPHVVDEKKICEVDEKDDATFCIDKDGKKSKCCGPHTPDQKHFEPRGTLGEGGPGSGTADSSFPVPTIGGGTPIIDPENAPYYPTIRVPFEPDEVIISESKWITYYKTKREVQLGEKIFLETIDGNFIAWDIDNLLAKDCWYFWQVEGPEPYRSKVYVPTNRFEQMSRTIFDFDQDAFIKYVDKIPEEVDGKLSFEIAYDLCAAQHCAKVLTPEESCEDCIEFLLDVNGEPIDINDPLDIQADKANIFVEESIDYKYKVISPEEEATKITKFAIYRGDTTNVIDSSFNSMSQATISYMENYFNPDEVNFKPVGSKIGIFQKSTNQLIKCDNITEADAKHIIETQLVPKYTIIAKKPKRFTIMNEDYLMDAKGMRGSLYGCIGCFDCLGKPTLGSYFYPGNPEIDKYSPLWTIYDNTENTTAMTCYLNSLTGFPGYQQELETQIYFVADITSDIPNYSGLTIYDDGDTKAFDVNGEYYTFLLQVKGEDGIWTIAGFSNNGLNLEQYSNDLKDKSRIRVGYSYSDIDDSYLDNLYDDIEVHYILKGQEKDVLAVVRVPKFELLENNTYCIRKAEENKYEGEIIESGFTKSIDAFKRLAELNKTGDYYVDCEQETDGYMVFNADYDYSWNLFGTKKFITFDTKDEAIEYIETSFSSLDDYIIDICGDKYGILDYTKDETELYEEAGDTYIVDSRFSAESKVQELDGLPNYEAVPVQESWQAVVNDTGEIILDDVRTKEEVDQYLYDRYMENGASAVFWGYKPKPMSYLLSVDVGNGNELNLGGPFSTKKEATDFINIKKESNSSKKVFIDYWFELAGKYAITYDDGQQIYDYIHPFNDYDKALEILNELNDKSGFNITQKVKTFYVTDKNRGEVYGPFSSIFETRKVRKKADISDIEFNIYNNEHIDFENFEITTDIDEMKKEFAIYDKGGVYIDGKYNSRGEAQDELDKIVVGYNHFIETEECLSCENTKNIFGKDSLEYSRCKQIYCNINSSATDFYIAIYTKGDEDACRLMKVKQYDKCVTEKCTNSNIPSSGSIFRLRPPRAGGDCNLDNEDTPGPTLDIYTPGFIRRLSNMKLKGWLKESTNIYEKYTKQNTSPDPVSATCEYCMSYWDINEDRPKTPAEIAKAGNLFYRTYGHCYQAHCLDGLCKPVQDCEICHHVAEEFGLLSPEWSDCYYNNCMGEFGCPECENTRDTFGMDSDEYLNCVRNNCQQMFCDKCYDIYLEEGFSPRYNRCLITKCIMEDSTNCCDCFIKFNPNTQEDAFLECLLMYCYRNTPNSDVCIEKDMQHTVDINAIYEGQQKEQVTTTLKACTLCERHITDALIKSWEVQGYTNLYVGKPEVVENIPYLADVFEYNDIKVKRLTRVWEDQDIVNYLGQDVVGLSEAELRRLIQETRDELLDVKFNIEVNDVERTVLESGIVKYCSWKSQCLAMCDKPPEIRMEEDCYYITFENGITQEKTEIEVCEEQYEDVDIEKYVFVESTICQEAIDALLLKDKELVGELMDLGLMRTPDDFNAIVQDYLKYNIIYPNREFLEVVSYICSTRTAYSVPLFRAFTGRESAKSFMKVDGRMFESKARLQKELAVSAERYRETPPEPLVVEVKAKEVPQQLTVIQKGPLDVIIPNTIVEADVAIDVMEKVQTHLQTLEQNHGFRTDEFIGGLKMKIIMPSTLVHPIPIESESYEEWKIPQGTLFLEQMIQSESMKEFLQRTPLKFDMEVRIISESVSETKKEIAKKILEVEIDQEALKNMEEELIKMKDKEVLINFYNFRDSLNRLANIMFFETPIDTFVYNKKVTNKETGVQEERTVIEISNKEY